MSMQINDEWHAAGYMKSGEIEVEGKLEKPSSATCGAHPRHKPTGCKSDALSLTTCGPRS